MSEPVKIPGFPAGANNLAPDYDLPRDQNGQTIAARSIINADVLDGAGKVRRRKGFTEAIAGTAMYGATSYRGAIHFVDDGALYRRDGGVSTEIRSGLALQGMRFLDLNGDLYYSNGVDTGLLRGATPLSWGVPYLDNPPAVITAAGSLIAGEYGVLCTLVRSDGEEGGCGPAARVTGQGFSVTAPSGNAAAVNIYATGANDDSFRKIATCAMGATVSFLSELGRGTELRTRFLRPMPPGRALAHFNGRIYAASGRVLWYSEPMRFGLCNQARNFLLFPADISEVVAHDDGIYVSADQLYFLQGTGPADFKQLTKSPLTIASGGVFPLPENKDVIALTTDGLAQLSVSGQVGLFNETVAIDPARSGAVLVRDQDGIRQYIGVGFNPEHQSGMVAADYMAAEIIRRS